jgi:hypothetical protein
MYAGSSKLKIVVLGYIVRGPLGGLVWHHLQYVLGLKKMGHEILFLEDSDDFAACYNPETFELTEDPTYGLTFLKNVFSKFDLQNNWAYFDAHKAAWHGKSKQEVFAFCASADMVLNVSAVNPLREWWASIPCRVLIDTDPAFTQIRHLTSEKDFALANLHTAFFSFGENIGKHGCTIPDDGFDWKPTRQPMVMDIWKKTEPAADKKWTTVMQWDSYKTQKYNDRIFGMKSMSFQEFESLPQLLHAEKFELALGSTTAPVDELKAKGWDIISSLVPTKTPWTYQEYIQQSKGEWSIAKHGYVASNSGWFSERTACYLASGKPVVVQDTGFSDIFETGKGLLAFSSVDEAVAAIEKVNLDYHQHCRAARNFVEENFTTEKVLTQLLKSVS